MDTILDISHAVTREDGPSFGNYLISLNFKNTAANVDMYQLANETGIPKDLKPVLEAYIELNKLYRIEQDPMERFTQYDLLMRALNRFAETKNNWVMKALCIVTKELIKSAIAGDKYIKKNATMIATKNVGDFEHEQCLTKAARTIHNAFKLCLNDRNEDSFKSRKQYVYFFVGQELKIYYKLQNRDLAKNMEIVLEKMSSNLPSLQYIEKGHALTYLYYSGIVYCGERDFAAAYKRFKHAFTLCGAHDKTHLEAILIYLIPLKFIVTKKYPNLQYLHSYAIASALYTDMITALITGDLKKFDREFQNAEIFYLKRNLYMAIEELRNFVILKLIKRVYVSNGSNPHLGIKIVTRGIEFAKFHSTARDLALRNVNAYSSDEVECLVANLIYQGLIKGYMSHSNGVLVLSKKDPFPRQVCDDPR